MKDIYYTVIHNYIEYHKYVQGGGTSGGGGKQNLMGVKHALQIHAYMYCTCCSIMQ